MLYETERLEFKEIRTDDLYKEVIAFANTDGGLICVGINDKGEQIGLDNVDDVYSRITNGIRDSIQPDVTIFVKYAIEEGRVIRIEVGEGTYKPYYLKAKGLKPSGVYVRHGTSSVPASPEQIRQMIKTADGDIYEELRSLEQELTFHAAAETFTKHKSDFGEDKYYVLGVRAGNSMLFTNLGLLLSDQCAHTIKVAVFADDAQTVFRDRKEFCGSLFEQLEETFDYLQLCNQNHSEISGLERKDFWDYPKAAIREALLNALVHRDYSFSGSIIINVNDAGMEFISLGGLLAGLTQEDIKNGISQPRNRKLAEVFHRLSFIEAYGTGIRRIFSLYKGCLAQPSIEVTPHSFKMVLPNMNTAGQGQQERSQPDQRSKQQVRAVLNFLAEHKEMNDQELQKLLGIKRTRAYVLTREMEEAGLIRILGRGVQRRYIPI